jgi:prolyl oligopeptidase
VPDPYRWLEDLDSDRTRQWIREQNELTAMILGHVPEREPIRARLEELWNYERFDVPFRRGGRYFFTRNDGLQNQSVLYVMDSPDAEPRALLDPNALSSDGTVALVGVSASDDGRLLAYGLATAGSDWQEWRIREVDSGRDLSDHLRWVKFSGLSWSPDGRDLYYSRYDAPREGSEFKGANYFHKLYRHRLGTPQQQDELVYHRPDQKEWGFAGQVTDDGRYLVISVWRGTHRENLVFYADRAAGGPVVELIRDWEASYVFLDNDGPVFYFRTDRDAPMGRILSIDTRDGSRREIVPESTRALESASIVGDSIVAHYLQDARSRVERFDLSGRPLGGIGLPGPGSVLGFEGRRSDPETFYLFTSFTAPGTVFRYDFRSGRSEIFRRPKLRFDPERFVTEQSFYAGKDGTRIPIFLTRRRDLRPDGGNPTYLYGYGGFNISLTPAFSPSVMAWLEMGGIFAQPNLRGGGEYGKPWHEAGMKLKKQNVFDDFIAAAEWLTASGWTRRDKLAIGGGSNGGLLVGACMTQRPDLFAACVPSVGVLDMLRFHKFTIGWAWTSDYGSPDDPEEFGALLAYSPYHNLKPGADYPATLVVTADHDDRVFPGHSFKFAARLQACQGGPAMTLIRIETRAGHGMGKPTSKLIEEAADRWAFLVSALGMQPWAEPPTNR